MKITHVIPAIAFIALSACETVPTADAPVSRAAHQITTLADFTQLIVGKMIGIGESKTFSINANGTLTGSINGAALEGTWTWEKPYWCRTLTTIRPGTDCQAWSVNGNEITIVRERGTGSTATYFLQ